ncbi:MAG: DUF89 domain-containing protein [Candidatus Thorarchaeota archaeon]
MPNDRCLSCLNEIAIRAIELSTNDTNKRELFIKEIKEKIKRDFSEIKLPDYSTELFAVIAKETGVDDPFLEIKKESNQFFIDLVPKIIDSFEGLFVKDIIYKLFLYSIAANMVDFSTGGHSVDLQQIADTIIHFPDEGLAIDDFNKLYEIINNSKKIIFLSDNCGEVVIDNLFVEFLTGFKNKEVYLGLKGSPVANDCMVDDFYRDKLPNNATEIFSVSNSFGYNLDQSSDRFKELLLEADLLIAKGQSNYETTLNNLVRHPNQQFPPIFCVLRTKCQIITDHLGVPLGSNVIKQMYPLKEEARKSLTEIIDCK